MILAIADSIQIHLRIMQERLIQYVSQRVKSNMDPRKGPEGRIYQYHELEASLKRRIRNTCIIGAVWASLILGSAGIFVLMMPSMDREREQRLLKEAEEEKLALEAAKSLKNQSKTSPIADKVKELNITASGSST